MSYYRQSPTRSPYKSRLEDKDLIEEEIHLKKVLRVEGQNRRLADELSILRLKLRKLEELEDKYDALLKQNGLLGQSNDQLAAELAERRYQIERLKAGTVQVQQRELFKNGQLLQVNRSLEMEIEILKKERFESSKVYEDHIGKLELLLEQKVKELEILNMNFDKLANEKEISEIRNEEERNKLKNEIARTSYQKDRELEMNKEKQYNQKILEIQTLKRNHASQISILEDEILKLKRINEIKMNEFEGQLIQNRNLKLSYEDELKKMADENDALRLRMAKLEEINRTEVESIQEKYNNIHSEDTESLKQHHGNEIRLLLSQLDRLKWLISDKNAEIQQLTKEKKEQRLANEERTLELNDQINTLKSQLVSQQDKKNQEAHELMDRINHLEDKMLRDSENYHDKVKHFTNQIEELEAEGKKREVNQDRSKREWELARNQLAGERDSVRQQLLDTKKSLNEKSSELESQRKKYNEYKDRNDKEKERLSKLLNEMEHEKERLAEKLEASSNNSDRDIQLLKQELESYKRTNEKLELALRNMQTESTEKLSELSEAHKSEVTRLEAAYRQRISQLERTFSQLRTSLENQVRISHQKLLDCQSQLQNLIEKYNRLDAHFKDPSKYVEFDPRGCASIFQAIKKTKESMVKIF